MKIPKGLASKNRKSGIYKFTNILNGVIYIGSASDFYNRFCDHKYDLRSNVHANNKFQRSYNKYGEENFTFEVLEIVEDKTKLIEREQHYLDTLLFAQEYIISNFQDDRFGELGYNINPLANGTFGYKHTEEAKKKVGDANRHPNLKTRGEKHYNFGGTQSKETNEKRIITLKKIAQTEERKASYKKFNDLHKENKTGLYSEEAQLKRMETRVRKIKEGTYKSGSGGTPKKVEVYDLNKNLLVTYRTINLAVEAGYDYYKIKDVSNGTLKNYKDLIFKIIEKQ